MVYTKTKAGNRFNAMRGLAIVAYKCKISEERFEKDINRLSMLFSLLLLTLSISMSILFGIPDSVSVMSSE